MKLKLFLIAFGLLCLAAILYCIYRYEIYESHPVLGLLFRKFLLPVFILTLICSNIFYRTVVRPDEKYIKPGFKKTIKTIQNTIIYSVPSTFFLLFTLHSIILITNEYMGAGPISLDAKVVRSYRTVHHGNESFHAELQDKSGTEINLAVKKLYKTGTVMDEDFKRGHWGIIYTTK